MLERATHSIILAYAFAGLSAMAFLWAVYLTLAALGLRLKEVRVLSVRIWGFRRGDTEWSFGCLPISAGFIRWYEEDLKRESVFKFMLLCACPVFVSFVLAAAILGPSAAVNEIREFPGQLIECVIAPFSYGTRMVGQFMEMNAMPVTWRALGVLSAKMFLLNAIGAAFCYPPLLIAKKSGNGFLERVAILVALFNLMAQCLLGLSWSAYVFRGVPV